MKRRLYDHIAAMLDSLYWFIPRSQTQARQRMRERANRLRKKR